MVHLVEIYLYKWFNNSDVIYPWTCTDIEIKHVHIHKNYVYIQDIPGVPPYNVATMMEQSNSR